MKVEEEEVETGNHVFVVSLCTPTLLLLLEEGGVLDSAGEVRLSVDCEKEEKQPVMMSQSSQTSATGFLSAEEELKTKKDGKPSQLSLKCTSFLLKKYKSVIFCCFLMRVFQSIYLTSFLKHPN